MYRSLNCMTSVEARLHRVAKSTATRHVSLELVVNSGTRRDCTTSTGVQNSRSPRFHFYPLDGSTTRLGTGLQAIREMRPKQIMLETCDQRKMLAERRLAASVPPPSGSDSTAGATSSDAAPISQTDAIDTVHGGVRGGDLVLVARAAADVGSQVYMIDRPYRDTQNAVARQLVLNPSWILPFIRHSLARIAALSSNVEHPSDTARVEHSEQSDDITDLESLCPGVHSVVASSRERYMAEKVAKFAVKGGDVFIFCTLERAKGLETLLADGGKQVLFDQQKDDKGRFMNAWPILLIFIYCMTPLNLSLYLMWHLSQWLARMFAEGGSRLRLATNSGESATVANACKDKELVA
mmetsp:Transcript_113539/g.177591  ORF Transcript_113539/g.177591 Transcript_113539/m.177591 type:complete len:352 (-) Transcript_113539:43-1098(-)